jgi:ABC-type amino acid transport substrate-binding protein
MSGLFNKFSEYRPMAFSGTAALLAFTLTALNSSTANAAEKWIFGYHDTLCPIVCDLEKSGQQGYLLDIVSEIGKSHDFEVVYADLPKSRITSMILKGEIDFTILPIVPIQKANLVKTDIPVVTYRMGVMRRRDFAFEFDGLESLKKVTWGKVAGERWRGKYHDYIEENKSSGRVSEVFGNDAYGRLTALVALQRVDVVISNFEMLRRFQRASKHSKNLVVSRTNVFGTGVPIYAAFSPHHPASKKRARILSEGLVALSQSGRLKEIFESYGVENVPIVKSASQ